MAEPDAGPGQPDDQEPDPQPEAAEASDSDEPEKRLEDLDPEDEEAAGVQGGKRYGGRYPGGRL